jgi:hypothetical protein
MKSASTAERSGQFVDGYLSQRAAREGSPKYGYPQNHVPPSTIDSLTLTTCFLAAKKNAHP